MKDPEPIAVVSLAELPEGGMRRIAASGREILLVRQGDKVYALRNTCPHQGARLSDGVLSCARVAGAVGEYRSRQGEAIVRCPWHNWEYCVTNGAALHDPQHVRVATYPVTVENGQVFVHSRMSGRSPS